MRKFLAAISLTAVVAQPALAWDDKGHAIIASIARDRLTPQARAWIDAILAKDTDTLSAPDMVSRATWADKWRDSGHRETASWHFVDVGLANPDLKTACFGYTIHSPSGCANDVAPIDLSNRYQAKTLATARQQLEKAGVRLAVLLNAAAAKARVGA